MEVLVRLRRGRKLGAETQSWALNWSLTWKRTINIAYLEQIMVPHKVDKERWPH